MDTELEYFDQNGKSRKSVNVASLSQSGYRKYLAEIEYLKKQNITVVPPRQMMKRKAASSKKKIIDEFVVNKNADNYFYYFRFYFRDMKFYKLGITSTSLESRYGADFSKIDKVLYCERIDGAIKIERMLKEKFQEDIFPLKYFNDGGHTEIYMRDILELDKDMK